MRQLRISISIFCADFVHYFSSPGSRSDLRVPLRAQSEKWLFCQTAYPGESVLELRRLTIQSRRFAARAQTLIKDSEFLRDSKLLGTHDQRIVVMRLGVSDYAASRAPAEIESTIRQPLLGWIQRRREIAFTQIRQHHNDTLAGVFRSTSNSNRG